MPDSITAPFTVIVDSREQAPFRFEGLTVDRRQGSVPLVVPYVRRKLVHGDYSIEGLPGIAIERKSKSDFLASLVRRENFEERLQRMSRLEYSAVLVEAEWSEIAKTPGRSKYPFKSMVRTVLAWDQRYPTSWFFVAGRRNAEKVCFRMLERFWKEHASLPTSQKEKETLNEDASGR